MITQIAWGAKVDQPFRDALQLIAVRFGWSPDHVSWLLTCIAFETGKSFSPSIMNAAGSGAVGLIQFMSRTAIALGTTTAQLQRMTAIEQLRFVERYFKPYASRIQSLTDMYMAILLPTYIGKPDTDVMFSDPTIGYRQNSALDYNSDSKITKGEVAQRIVNMYNSGLKEGNVWVLQ